jgi:GTPase SAR1 family protein
MNEPLITGEIRLIVSYIQRIKKIINKIESYPENYFQNILNKDDRIGSRTIYWMVSAIRGLMSFDYKRNRCEFDIGRLISYVLANYTVDADEDRESFWIASILHMYQRLREIIYRYSSIQSYDDSVRQRVDANIGKYISLLNNQLDNEDIKKTESDHASHYFKYWVYSALMESGALTEERWKEFVNISKKYLNEQLAMRVSNPSASNHIILAISARAIREAAFRENSGVNAVLRKQAEYTTSICFSCKRDHLYGRKLVLNIRDFGQLYSVPWEDLLILCGHGTEVVCGEPHAIGELIEAMEYRLESDENGHIGVIDEGSQGFPQPNSFFTFYSITLLSELGCMLRKRLALCLAERLRKKEHLPTGYQEKIIPKLDGEDYLETIEGVGDYLQNVYSSGSLVDLKEKIQKHNTILLFGPPGTGKTTLVRSLVRYFNDQECEMEDAGEWTLLTLNPGAFLGDDSYSSIFATVSDVFCALRELDHCVVFIDEAEELLRTREEKDDRLGRLFTAAMLPQLNTLSGCQSLFIFATNFAEKMDAAAIRKGRFTIRKGVGWLSKESLKKHVDDSFEVFNSNLKRIILDHLIERPIKEVLDITARLKSETMDNGGLTETKVNKFFADWKDYWRDELKKQHIENDRDFDDSYNPLPKQTTT